MNFSERILSVSASQSVMLAQKVIDLRARGEKVIGFNVGEPDFKTPEDILKATNEALFQGETRYGAINGIEPLRAAIANKLKKDQNLDIPLGNISIAKGSKHVLYNIFQILCEKGDEVIVPCPYWVSFSEMIKLAGAKPVLVYDKSSFFSLEKIKEAITPNTKAIIINSPNNPSGMMIAKEDMKELVELARKNRFMIISDEAYEGLVFDDKKFVSPSALADPDFEVTISVQSFSKTFCMTGFRVGYLVTNSKFIQAFNRLQSHLSGNVAPFVQYGAVKALEKEEEIKAFMTKTFRERRDLAHKELSQIVDSPKPEGAFYLFPKVSDLYTSKVTNDIELAEHILDHAKVAILPGTFFGYPDHLRICYAASKEDIVEGIQKIKACL